VSEGSPTEEFGPYTVYEQLGVGGMAQVHRAVMTGSEARRPVALKRMLSHIAGSQDMVKSFVREARLASYLRHPNVAQTYEIGRVGDVYFIVMELITGRNLREVLRHCGATTGPMPVPVVLNILNQVCDALDYAHNLCDEHGKPLQIIHRDVSPSNVIVSDTGLVKLIDFGIAKASGAGMQTMSGTLKGKFAYMAPEYIAGRLDARADLFAVGVIAHELLTNRPLFSGRDDIDTLTRVRDMRIPPPSKKNPKVPPEIDDIVMTALSRDPDRRWQHATALRSALTTLTQRLGMVVTNAQVVQWLDWAFTIERKRRRPTEPDTETDAAPLGGELDLSPEISIEPRTFDQAVSQKVTRVVHEGAPAPPAAAPAGTPSYLAAARPAPPVPAAIPQPIADGSEPSRRHAGLSPNITANGIGPTKVRSSSSFPTRLASPSAAPPLGYPAPPNGHAAAPAFGHSAAPPAGHQGSSPLGHPGAPPLRPSTAQLAVPMRAATVPSGPIPLPAPPPGFHAAPAPAVPSYNAAPFAAPRPSTPSQPMPFVDPARSAVVMREFEQRATASTRNLAPVAPDLRGIRAMPTVVWVVLAAVAAAIAVYFVLPLLT
jgi:serine/threonine protein kinase